MTRSLLFVVLTLSVSASASAQQLAVDHVWIRVTRGAPEAQALADAGLRFVRFDQGSSIVPVASSDGRVVQHAGQGTASIIVRFRNMYLELIWVESPELLAKVAPEHGYTLLDSERSPIGIGLRHLGEDGSTLPFESSSHWAPWMRPTAALATARRDTASPTDPAIFVIPRYLRYDLRTKGDPKLLEWAEHSLDLREVSKIRVHGPGLPSRSQAVRLLEEQRLVEFVPATTHTLEIEFDGRREVTLDFRPSLPLTIYHGGRR
jgi:hypothetical protein